MDVIQPNQSPVMLSPSDWQGMLQGNKISDEEKLALTSGEFESTLVRQYLKDALKPLVEGALKEDGVAQNIYRGYYTDIMAQSLTKGAGFGVSSVLQSQLTTNNQSKGTDAS